MRTAIAQRWTDGLPILPPEVEEFERARQVIDTDLQTEIAVIPPANGILDTTQLIIQSLMAGCLPEYIPIVRATIEAMMDPRFNLMGVQTTTGPVGPLIIANGPVSKQLGINSGPGLFCHGRANIAIGRAIRLILWNVGGGYYGETDMATFGHQGKISLCLGEAESDSPWPSLAVDQGMNESESVVSVIAADAPNECLVTSAGDNPFRILDMIADVASILGPVTWVLGDEMHLISILSPRVAHILSGGGFTKADVRQYLFEHARRRVREIEKRTLLTHDEVGDLTRRSADDAHWFRWIDINDPEAMVPVAKSPEQVHIVVAGGLDSMWCAVCPSWGGHGGWLSSRKVN